VARSRPREAEPHGRGARDQVARARRAGGAGGVARGACLAWSIYIYIYIDIDIYIYRERERERGPPTFMFTSGLQTLMTNLGRQRNLLDHKGAATVHRGRSPIDLAWWQRVEGVAASKGTMA
jgi:hypothetical protein